MNKQKGKVNSISNQMFIRANLTKKWWTDNGMVYLHGLPDQEEFWKSSRNLSVFQLCIIGKILQNSIDSIS